ncbi:MAG: hypothetical protein A2919_01970 [Candidatus Spechtbacteria bacterium RIFCSPLOWO2_01_FULL_43_12]|uniref:Uncharacterized protein n=1 Tax=Candidatus Spechtbacteria bacterium RIFCSPLOWO2_01_FULL_43_12 TaxID=1802162 RepID=A0A1G2HEE5_9BACT|nr:MAG: hypothetical protein A2919_01970 [Candidatus Spechtbacteria bacterium RIFCSPLOWO2_01_FULL_43_12]
MNLFKIIFATALAIILVVSTLVALFGVGRAVNATLRTYILQVEECRYQPRILAPTEEGDKEKVIDQEECKPDYNRAKQDVAEGAGMFIVSAPLAWFMYRQTRRMMEDSK